MKRSSVTIAVLACALIGTNTWWAYKSLDAGISLTYLKASHDTAAELLNQALALLPVVANPAATRSEVVSAAQSVAATGTTPYEKLGFVWVGQLGLKFNEEGRFLEAVTTEPVAE